jgi:hypothetical protein
MQLRIIRKSEREGDVRIVHTTDADPKEPVTTEWTRTLRQAIDKAAQSARVDRVDSYDDEYYDVDGVHVRPFQFTALSFCIRYYQALGRWWANAPLEVDEEWLKGENAVVALWPYLAYVDEINPLDGLATCVELTSDALSDCDPVTVDIVAADDGSSLMHSFAEIGQVIALQMAAFVADRAPARRCANETCGRYFVRQRGRARAGQHHLRGVKYCTDSCARAKAQREYRRRATAR